MTAVLVILVVVLVLVMGFALFGSGPAQTRRRVILTPVRRRRRTVVEDVVHDEDPLQPGAPRTTRRVTEYDE